MHNYLMVYFQKILFLEGSKYQSNWIILELENKSKYSKVMNSRPGYYSILDPFVQRSQYISIKFSLHKQSENPCACSCLQLNGTYYVITQILKPTWQIDVYLIEKWTISKKSKFSQIKVQYEVINFSLKCICLVQHI